MSQSDESKNSDTTGSSSEVDDTFESRDDYDNSTCYEALDVKEYRYQRHRREYEGLEAEEYAYQSNGSEIEFSAPLNKSVVRSHFLRTSVFLFLTGLVISLLVWYLFL